MDKYQEKLLSVLDSGYCIFSTNGTNAQVQLQDKLVLKQNRDITINDYTLLIPGSAIESVAAVKEQEKVFFSKDNENNFICKIDFDNTFDSLVI
jgi:hypothetical protein